MANLSAKPTLPPELLASLHRIEAKALGRLVAFLGLYLLGAGAAIALAQALPEAWWWRLPAYLLAAASLHGVSLFVHEGVHGVLLKRPWANHLLAVLCGLPVGQCFAAYRVLHLRHHANLGQPGDPDHYPNYTDWSWLEYLMHMGRLLIGYPVYVTMIPILGWRQASWAERGPIAAEVLALGFLVAAAWAYLPALWFWHGWFWPMVLINTMVNVRGMSQHTWLGQQGDPVHGSRSIHPHPVVRYFMANENYHLEHHLYPGVPWHHLGQLHAALAPELAARQAPTIPSYTAFVWDFLRTSFKLSPLGRALGGAAR